ncbi:MAG: ABC-type transport auxiliary lipoprotein family protein [Candidatus Cloacimonetes bacterium]|nr:ABC-type transport auxiliary lipoprotein family protein [Candidatus Cloacimonadota bacterium]
MKTRYPLLLVLAALAVLAGCSWNTERLRPNYYVLEYKEGSENPALRAAEPFPASLEVLDAEVNRAYSKSQLVVKENFSRVRYLPDHLWASRLGDAVPDLITQRLRAYNIFSQVDRTTGEFDPDYFLETKILNLEKIEAEQPRAYLRMEFFLRDSNTQQNLLSYKAERYKGLPDDSMVYLIQSYNEMLMLETDVFAAKCRQFLGGEQGQAEAGRAQTPGYVKFLLEDISGADEDYSFGELLLRLGTATDDVIRYNLLGVDNDVSRNDGEFNKELTLPPGRYEITIGENQNISLEAEVRPKMRTVVSGQWAELTVKIIDENNNRVRLPYDVWVKEADKFEYYPLGPGSSIGDDDLGQPDKVWILPPGTYMIKLGGGAWNELRDFTTVDLANGDSRILTLVVDPSGEGNLLLGAGVLGEEPVVRDRPVVHKGSMHGNISLAGNNQAGPENPVNSITVTGQLENSVDATFPYTLYTLRSIYDLGLSSSNFQDLRVSADTYSLKNVLLFTPWQNSRPLRNFSFYARGDVQTHFFKEISYFAQDRDLILISARGDTVSVLNGQDRLQTKQPLFPMRLKEGTGITYRLAFSPRASLSLRFGYGWQQEVNTGNYVFSESGPSQIPGDTGKYDIYREQENLSFHGIESTLVFSAVNILDFIRVNSSFDVLFPFSAEDRSAHFESEHRINFRIYRNISLDLRLNVQYDRSQQDWVVYDYGSYLRLSLFY